MLTVDHTQNGGGGIEVVMEAEGESWRWRGSHRGGWKVMEVERLSWRCMRSHGGGGVVTDVERQS